MDLNGRVSIVTGGARGVGRGVAVELARRGANVVVADLLDDVNVRREAATTVEAVQALGVDAVAVQCDVRDERQVEAMVARAVERFGHIDIACANAGVIRETPLASTSVEDWQLVLDVNLNGTFLLARAVAGRFTAQRSGVFIVVSSVAAFRGGVGYTAYCASKAGLIGFTQAMATELAPFGVRANAICPGYLATTMWYNDILPSLGEGDRAKQFSAVIEASVPLGRPQTPEDIGRAAVYLCEAENVTGIALTVDGGHVAGP